MTSAETAARDGLESRDPAGALYAGALDDGQKLVRKHLVLVSKLLAAGRIEEAQVALSKAERQAAGVFACMKKGTKKDRAYKAMLEDELDDLRRHVTEAVRKNSPHRLTKKRGLLLMAGLAVLIVLAAMAVVP